MKIIKKKKINKNFSIEIVIKIADIVVKKFVKNNSIHYSEFEDVRQSILEKYLLKKDKIEAAYTGQAKPETYISAILYRMVLEIIRTEKNKLLKQSDFEDNITIFNKEKIINPEEQLIIKNEKEFLSRILYTLGEQRAKITLFIKFFYQIQITENDVKQYAVNKDFNHIYNLFQQNKELKDKEIYNILCDVHNFTEEKKIKPDAVRMYINKNIEKIISRLNGRNNRTFYTKKTLGLLL